MLTSDQEATSRRRIALADYLAHAVDDGERLVCESASLCRSSMRAGQQLVEGQLSHVGDHYELSSDGLALRIVVVSKQVGGSLDHGRDRGHEHVSVARRSEQVESAKYGAMPHPRTSHMVGTELALKILLGGDAGGPATLVIGHNRPHVFDCMALVNSTLCSRAGDNSGGEGSRTMFGECRRHLAETMTILAPTIVLAQGWSSATAKTGGPSVANTVSAVFGTPPPRTDPHMAVKAMPWGDVAIVTAYHPSRHWSAASTPYWKRLEPILQAARAAIVR
jgi:hypothetical protein